jgi:hypothetical protein
MSHFAQVRSRIQPASSVCSPTDARLALTSRPFSRIIARCVCILACLACAAADASAQAALTVKECIRCSLAAVHLFDIPADTSDSNLGSPESIVAGPASLYFVVSSETPGEIHAYDRRGRLVRTLGRLGDGPGEFRYIRSMAGTPDTLWVADQGNNRLTVIGPDLEVARTENLPMRPIHIAPLPDGDVLVNADIRTQELVGFPLHQIRNGRIIRSFGYHGSAVRFDMSSYPGWRRIAVAEQSIWVMHVDRYTLEEWSFEGQLLRAFRHEPDWLRTPAGPVRGYSPDSKPPTTARGLHVVSPGVVIAAFAVARDDFAAGLRFRRSADHGSYVIDRIDRVFEARVEVIDVGDGSVVTSSRWEGFPLGFVRPGVLALLHSHEDGSYSIAVTQLQFTEGEP